MQQLIIDQNHSSLVNIYHLIVSAEVNLVNESLQISKPKRRKVLEKEASSITGLEFWKVTLQKNEHDHGWL